MNSIDALASLTTPSAAPASKANEIGSSERFLKLLVAQMQNQDPLNPMDNAQVTSQMAQINTVSGLEKLNTTVLGLNGSMTQLQALQGASLVGREITVEGTQVANIQGLGVGGFELTANADRVTVEILNPGGRVVGTVDLGAQTVGRHGFQWDGATDKAFAGHTFRVTAKAGASELAVRPLMLDQVLAVRTGGDQLTLETFRSGTLPYTKVLAVN
jgi:flagellar basal-body rod modification protein FlgD